ncbi:MAG TPA: isocitrate/isopropylmalate dehydrogenase family protein [Alphaproteobacteria bacterium]|nr:isocitrate/isopropylmalate dehydrogenase family protein [Alphaproteobacteria bacterium]
MTNQQEFRICELPGDGIGIEVMEAARAVLAAAQERVGGFRLAGESYHAGAAAYRDTGTAMADEAWRAADEADAILLGAMGLPDVRYPDGTEIAPQVELRFEFHLYAGLRPIRVLTGGPRALADPRAADIDFVLIRESTEGLFAARGKGELIGDQEARDTMVITRATSEKLFDFAFSLAERRRERGHPGKVTLVDKANIFTSMAFFRKVFDERAHSYPELATERLYVDACALDFVRRPWDFDVLVTENMYGDILSDLGAGLIGGMGFAPSADIGDEHAVFQPSHGTAPDIAGSGKANPTAMILSASMMLDWLGHRHGVTACSDASRLIDNAVETVFAEKTVRPYDIGGTDGTAAMAKAVIEALRR